MKRVSHCEQLSSQHAHKSSKLALKAWRRSKSRTAWLIYQQQQTKHAVQKACLIHRPGQFQLQSHKKGQIPKLLQKWKASSTHTEVASSTHSKAMRARPCHYQK